MAIQFPAYSQMTRFEQFLFFALIFVNVAVVVGAIAAVIGAIFIQQDLKAINEQLSQDNDTTPATSS